MKYSTIEVIGASKAIYDFDKAHRAPCVLEGVVMSAFSYGMFERIPITGSVAVSLGCTVGCGKR